MNIIVKPQGNLDVTVSALLQQKIAALVGENYTHYFIDLAGVKSLGHCGVSTLLMMGRLVRKTGKRLSLCNLNTSVLYILEISDLARELDISDPDDEREQFGTTIVV
jgi:anti-sigma B factor antagonist